MYCKYAHNPGFRFVLVVLPTLLLTSSVLLAQNAGDDIKSLQKKRSMMLDEVVTICRIQHEQGKIDFDVLAKAQREALKAKLEMAENPKDRIAVLKKMLDHGIEGVERLESRQKMGLGNYQHDLLQAQAFVLENRIELLKEEQKFQAADNKKD